MLYPHQDNPLYFPYIQPPMLNKPCLIKVQPLTHLYLGTFILEVTVASRFVKQFTTVPPEFAIIEAVVNDTTGWWQCIFAHYFHTDAD